MFARSVRSACEYTAWYRASLVSKRAISSELKSESAFSGKANAWAQCHRKDAPASTELVLMKSRRFTFGLVYVLLQLSRSLSRVIHTATPYTPPLCPSNERRV